MDIGKAALGAYAEFGERIVTPERWNQMREILEPAAEMGQAGC